MAIQGAYQTPVDLTIHTGSVLLWSVDALAGEKDFSLAPSAASCFLPLWSDIKGIRGKYNRIEMEA
jgi:hypothetical protein